MIRKYKTDILILNMDQTLRINGSNSFTLVNTGTTDALLNGFIIKPGETYADNGWPHEENHSNYNIKFTTGAGELTLFIKLYI